MTKIGPHSRPDRLAIIDGRRAEAKLMKCIREELVQHIGGSPSATQKLIIDQAVMLKIRLVLMDRETMRAGGVMSERNGRQYLAWSASLNRLLRQLGHGSASARPLTPAEALQRVYVAAANP